MRDRGFATAVAGGIAASLAVTATYWPALGNGFVWDDWVPLVDSPVFREPARWREALLTPPLQDPVGVRPLAMLSFMLQLWAGHREPAPFHLANIGIHALNVLLLVLLVWRVLSEGASRQWVRAVAAASSGLLYGLHPALTEPVAWISCRYDLLMTFFLLLGLLLDRMLPAGGWPRACLVGAAFFAAMLSKETAVGFLPALPLVHLALVRRESAALGRAFLVQALAAHGRVYAALFAAFALYLAGRFALYGPALGLERMIAQFGDVGAPGERMLAFVASYSRHVHDALWPFQRIVPSRSLQLPISVTEVAPTIAAAAGATTLILLAARAGDCGRRLMLLFMAFLAAIAPVSNLLPLPGRPGELWVASRYLTFPLVFVCLAAPFAFRLAESLLARHVSRPRALLAALAAAWLAASFASVRVTVPLWRDDGTLNEWAIASGAASDWRYSNLGEYYFKTRALDKAREAFLNAVRLRGTEGYHWYHLGIAEAALGNSEQARRAFRQALELNRDIIRARIDLAKLELAAGDPQAAAKVLQEGVERLPYSDDPGEEGTLRYLLGRAYGALGRSEQAAAQLRAALRLAQNPADRRAAEEALRALAP
ncbi:MAG TPA: tetratricopeptide repeat protein [Burkholderiales bacterium]|nr:tetratricopeptide repeat protein [Burkholderiales bacterium]